MEKIYSDEKEKMGVLPFPSSDLTYVESYYRGCMTRDEFFSK